MKAGDIPGEEIDQKERRRFIREEMKEYASGTSTYH